MRRTSVLTDISKAVKDLIEEYGIAKENEYVQKPISYALYNTWKSWDKREKPRMTVSRQQQKGVIRAVTCRKRGVEE